MPPRTWRRPYTAIYDDNYKFGNSLYSGTLENIEKKYHDTLRQTHVRSDRPDLTLSTFMGSNIISGPMPTPSSEPTVPRLRGGGSPSRGRNPESILPPMLQTSLSDSDVLGRMRPFGELDSGRLSLLADDEFFADLEERKARRKRRRRPELLDQLPEEMPQTQDSTYWLDKCRDLQVQLEQVSQTVIDAEKRIKNDVNGTKNKIHTELTDLALALDASNQQNSELQKLIKRQAKQVIDLQSNYEEVQRHLQDSLEQLASSERRCHVLKTEMNNLRSSVEQASRNRV